MDNLVTATTADDPELDAQYLRQWAIEQAIMLRGTGAAPGIILDHAEKFLAFVRDQTK